MPQRGTIKELSTALFQCWRPDEFFVIFTAYLDESGTHGGSPHTIMAGAFGSARQWTAFEYKYNAMRQKYQFRYFHAKEFKDTDGQFKTWSRQNKKDFAFEFSDLMGDTLGSMFHSFLNREDYNKYYKFPPLSGKHRWDTEYAVCFRALVDLLMDEMVKRNHKKNVLHIVMERGAKHSGDALRVFNWVKDDLQPKYGHLLGSMSFDEKKSCPYLATADFLAYSRNIFRQRLDDGKKMAVSDELRAPIWDIEIKEPILTFLRRQVLRSRGR
jgi:hypothetical protein